MTAPEKARAAFGGRLARHRHDRGWSQRQAAAATGLGLATINRAEHGQPVNLDTAVRLAAVYGTTLDALLNGTGTP